MIPTKQLQELREKANVGECIRIIMVAKDVKTTDIAAELRITSSYANMITKNIKVPSVRLMDDLLKYFDISFKQFSYLVDYYNNYNGKLKFEHTLYETLKIILKSEENKKNIWYFEISKYKIISQFIHTWTKFFVAVLIFLGNFDITVSFENLNYVGPYIGRKGIMEEKKVYTHKDLKELNKKLKKSTRDLTFRTTLYYLLASIADEEIAEGKKIEELSENPEAIKELSSTYENLIESFEEHENIVAELKVALTSFYSDSSKNVTKES